MNKSVKKIISTLLASAILLSVSAVAFADEVEVSETKQVFTDMPDDWRTEAIQNAVDNGLISGVGDGKVAPDAPITRAQMAAIIVRALGAKEKADISVYTDVDENAWYYDELAKAVYMNAFSGDGNNMYPDKEITFQECFTVLSRVFALDLALKSKTDAYPAPAETYYFIEDYENSLSLYADANLVADWAKLYYGSIVYGGYWSGGEQMLLRPTEYITRGEFAVVMDNLVEMYITEPGVVTELPEGNIVVRANDVVLDNIKHKGNVIIADSVEPEKVSLNDVEIDGRLVFRGCAAPGYVDDIDDEGNVVGQKLRYTTFVGCTPTGKATRVVLAVPYIFIDPTGMQTYVWTTENTCSLMPPPTME